MAPSFPCQACDSYTSPIYCHDLCFTCYRNSVKNNLENLCIALCKLEKTDPAFLDTLEDDMQEIDMEQAQVFPKKKGEFTMARDPFFLNCMIERLFKLLEQREVWLANDDSDSSFSYSDEEEEEDEEEQEDQAWEILNEVQEARLRYAQNMLHMKRRRVA